MAGTGTATHVSPLSVKLQAHRHPLCPNRVDVAWAFSGTITAMQVSRLRLNPSLQVQPPPVASAMAFSGVPALLTWACAAGAPVAANRTAAKSAAALRRQRLKGVFTSILAWKNVKKALQNRGRHVRMIGSIGRWGLDCGAGCDVGRCMRFRGRNARRHPAVTKVRPCRTAPQHPVSNTVGP